MTAAVILKKYVIQVQYGISVLFWAIFLALLGLPTPRVMAQSINLNTPSLEEYLRRQQLLGNLDSIYSFMIRPVSPAVAFGKEIGLDLDGTFTDLDKSTTKIIADEGNQKFRTLPVSFRSQYNSEVAFGINNGAMIPNKGLQWMLSAGIYYEYERLSIQIQPEVIVAQNKNYEGFPLNHDGSTWIEYYEWLNFSDIPERFGRGSYARFLPGQSSIRYNTDYVSLGISTENLWWGPGRRNSLLMSNNASGFLHGTINTQKPIHSSVGSFEGQLIAGRLQNSGYPPPHSDYVYRETPLYVPKRDQDWRYLAGLSITYQLKWVPGLTLGYSSVSQMYHNDMQSLADYLPVFNGGKNRENIIDTGVAKRNQLSSGSFRWMDPKGHFEFYGEYGSNGNSRTINDFITNPDRNRAFTLGFLNLFSLKKPDQFIQLGGELTQTGQTVRETIFDKNSWYTHPHVRHGYTHRGEVLGAGYGPGSNVLFLEAAWVKDFNKIGFQIERIENNNDFYYKRFEDIKDWRVKYVDVVPALLAEWRVENLLLSSKLQYAHSFNYKWYIVNIPGQYWVPGYDKNNIVAHLSISYIFPY
jgi:hypothetical protein